MDQKIVQKLIKLNSEFYQTFASHFSATRQRLQSGVQQVIKTLPAEAHILDLGCGNGELARVLATKEFRGRYLGLDFSAGLLEIARQGVARKPNFTFVQGDLGDAWEKIMGGGQRAVGSELSDGSNHSQSTVSNSPFTIILSFATFHHLPGRALYLQNYLKIHSLLAPEGRFIHSNWQFLNSERLRQRIQPWSEIGVTEAEVDPGDYLLDWRQGGRGLRYCHFFSAAELNELAAETGFKVVDSFYSDGEGGNLGLYQVWKKR
jgi:tRNA (uracil-5-)-methyltransferase TRM9